MSTQEQHDAQHDHQNHPYSEKRAGYSDSDNRYNNERDRLKESDQNK